jgi:hypothetical protein
VHFSWTEEKAERPVIERATIPSDPDYFLSPFRDVRWMSDARVEKAVRRTGKELRYCVEMKQVGALIDEIISDSLTPFLEALIPEGDWKRLEKLAHQVLEYAQLVEKFRAHAFPIASIPEDIVFDVESQIGTTAPRRVSKKKKQFYWEREFYPRILGAYSAIFNSDPDTNAWQDNDGGVQHWGPTAGFLDEVLEAIAERLDHSDVQAAFPYHKALDLLREASDPPALRGRIERWRKEDQDPEIDPDQSWRSWKNRIETALKIN